MKHIEYIRKVNPILNAVVKDRFDRAREEAKRADDDVKSSTGKDLAPFHGVPCTIKESFALKGMPNTSGFVEMGRELQRELVELIGRNGVILYPCFKEPAPARRKPMLYRHVAYTAVVNIMEFPSTQVPLGLNQEGLPLGAQVIGAQGNDHLTIAVAMELEKAFGGWVPPFETD